jgi:hypothetical protein
MMNLCHLSPVVQPLCFEEAPSSKRGVLEMESWGICLPSVGTRVTPPSLMCSLLERFKKTSHWVDGWYPSHPREDYQ